MPFFSVVIPCFNRRDLVNATLESVFAQSFTDFEVIVVDDGSTDGTFEMIEAWTPRVKVIRQANGGAARARNAGLREAVGEYVAFLDSDDLWFPWTLATYAEALERHGRPSMLHGRDRHFREPAELIGLKTETAAAASFRDFYAAGGAVDCYGASWLVAKRGLLADAGGFDPAFHSNEDIDLLLRIGDAPGFVMLERPITFGYRVHGGSLIGDFERAWPGIQLIIDREMQGRYPGGPDRAAERRVVIGKAARTCLLTLIATGKVSKAWEWYRRLFPWHVRQGRWRFLAAAPALMAMKLAGRIGGPKPDVKKEASRA